MDTKSRTTKLLAGGALVLAGVGAGAVLAVSGSASASTDAAYGGGYGAGHGPRGDDPAQGRHAGEKPLTGTTAAKVKAAALAKYPGATVQRLETDSEGVYEAHLLTKAGKPVIVQVGKDFTVTGTRTGGPDGSGGPRGKGGPGGRPPGGEQGGPGGEAPGTGTPPSEGGTGA